MEASNALSSRLGIRQPAMPDVARAAGQRQPRHFGQPVVAEQAQINLRRMFGEDGEVDARALHISFERGPHRPRSADLQRGWRAAQPVH